MLLKNQKYKELVFFSLVIIILNNGCDIITKAPQIKYGRESRLVSSLISMNCAEENLAVYNEFVSFRISRSSYELVNFEEVGNFSKVFSIKFSDDIGQITSIVEPRISICVDGNLYIGRPLLKGVSSLPPECHFVYKCDETGSLNISETGELYLKSIPFITLEEYEKLIINK